MAMKPSCTPMCSRIDIATTVPRNHADDDRGEQRVRECCASTPRLARSVTRLWPRKPYHHMQPSVMRNVTIRIGNDDGRPWCQMKSKNSAPATLCSICGGRSPMMSAEPMKFAPKPIIRMSGTGRQLERARERQRDRRHHQDRHDVVDEHRDEAREERQDHDEQPGPPAGELQRLHREPARHAGLAEVAGDDPDADQNRHHVPVDVA